MMWWGGSWGWGAWLAMSLTMVAFWGFLVWGLVSAARSGDDNRRDRSEDILADRFARGEIDEDEFRRRRDLIRAQR